MDEEPLSTSFKWSFPTSPHFIKEIIIGIILVICLGIPIHVATEYPHFNSGSADLLEDESENDEINADGVGRRRRGNSRSTSLSRHEASGGEALQTLLLRPHSRKFVLPLPTEKRFRDNGSQEGVKVTSGGIACRHVQQGYPAMDERLQHRWNEACETTRREAVIRRQEMVGLPRCHSENRSRLGQQMSGQRSSDAPRSPRPRSVPSSPVAMAEGVAKDDGHWGGVCMVPWPTAATLSRGMEDDCNVWSHQTFSGVVAERCATTMSCFTSGIILSDCGCIAAVHPSSVPPLHLPHCLPQDEPSSQTQQPPPPSPPSEGTQAPTHSPPLEPPSQPQPQPSPPLSPSQSHADVSPPTRNPIVTAPNTDVDEQSQDSYVSEEEVTVRKASKGVSLSEGLDTKQSATNEECRDTLVSERVIQNVMVDPPRPMEAPNRSDMSVYYDSEDGASSSRKRVGGKKKSSSTSASEETKCETVRPLTLKGGQGSTLRVKSKIQPCIVKSSVLPARTVGTQATGSRGLFLCQIDSDGSDDSSSDDTSMVTSRSTASVRSIASQINESMLEQKDDVRESEFVSCIDICPKREISERHLIYHRQKGKLFSRHSETKFSEDSSVFSYPECLASNQLDQNSLSKYISKMVTNNTDFQQKIHRNENDVSAKYSTHMQPPVLNQRTEFIAQHPMGENVYQPIRDTRPKAHSRHSHHRSTCSRLSAHSSSSNKNPPGVTKENEMINENGAKKEELRNISNVRVSPSEIRDESLSSQMRHPITAPTRIPSMSISRPPPPPPSPSSHPLPPSSLPHPLPPPSLPHPLLPHAFTLCPSHSPFAPPMRLREDMRQTPSQATLSCALSPSRAMLALQTLPSHPTSNTSTVMSVAPPLTVRRSSSATTRECNFISDNGSSVQSERSASFMSLHSSSSSSRSSLSTTSMGASACALARLRLSSLSRRQAPVTRQALHQAMHSDLLLRHARSSSGDWGGASGVPGVGVGSLSDALAPALPETPASATAADNIERKGQQLFKRSRQMVWRLTNRTRAFRERLRMKYGWAMDKEDGGSSTALPSPLDKYLKLRSNSSRGDSSPSVRDASLHYHTKRPSSSGMKSGSPSLDFGKFSINRQSSPWDSNLYTKLTPSFNTCPAEIDTEINKGEKPDRRVSSTEGRCLGRQPNFSSEIRSSSKNICSQESTTKRFVHRVSRHVRHTYKYVADVGKEARKRESVIIRTEREETVRNLSRQQESGCSFVTASGPRTDCSNCICNESKSSPRSKENNCLNNQSADSFPDWKSALNSLLQPQDGAFKILGNQVVMHCTTPTNIKNVWASTTLKKTQETDKNEVNVKGDATSSDNPATNSSQKSDILKTDSSKSKSTSGPHFKSFEPEKHRNRAKERASKYFRCRRSRVEERRELSSDEWQDASERMDSSLYSASGPVSSSSVVRTIRSKLSKRDEQTDEKETQAFVLPKYESDTSESEGDANFDSIFKLLLKSSVAYNYKVLGHRNNTYVDKASQVILNKVSQKIGRGTSPRRVKDACIGRTKRLSDTCDFNPERESGREDNCNTMELISSIPSSLVANDSPNSATADTNVDTRAMMADAGLYENDTEVLEKSPSMEKRVWVSDSGLKEKKGREALMEALVNVCRDATGMSCKYRESRASSRRRLHNKLTSNVEKCSRITRPPDGTTSSRDEITSLSPSNLKKVGSESPSTSQVAVSKHRSSLISSLISRKSPPCLKSTIHKSRPSLVCKSRSLRLSISYARDSLRSFSENNEQNVCFSATVSKENITPKEKEQNCINLSQGSKENEVTERGTSSKPSLKVLTMMASKPQKSSSQMLFMIPKPREHDAARQVSSSSVPDKRVVQRAINSAISKLREIMCSDEFRGRLKMEANAAIAIAVSAARNTAKKAVRATTRRKKRRTPAVDRKRESHVKLTLDRKKSQAPRAIEMKPSDRMREKRKIAKKRDKHLSLPRPKSSTNSPSMSHSQTSIDEARDDVPRCSTQYEKSIGDERESKTGSKVDKVKHFLGDFPTTISRESLELLDKCSTSSRIRMPCEVGTSIATAVKGTQMLTSSQRKTQILHELQALKSRMVPHEDDTVSSTGDYIHVRRSRGLLTIAQSSQVKIKKSRFNASSRKDIKDKKEHLSEGSKKVEKKVIEAERDHSMPKSEFIPTCQNQKSKELLPIPTKSLLSSKHKSSVVILHPRKKSFIDNISFKTDSEQSAISVTSDPSDMKSEMDASYNLVQQLAVVQEETEKYDTDGGTDQKIIKLNSTCRSQSTQISVKKPTSSSEENSRNPSEKISQSKSVHSTQMVDHTIGNTDNPCTAEYSCTSSFHESCQIFKNKERKSSILIHECTQTSKTDTEHSESVRKLVEQSSCSTSLHKAERGSTKHPRRELEVQVLGSSLPLLQTKGNQTEEVHCLGNHETEPLNGTHQLFENESDNNANTSISEPAKSRGNSQIFEEINNPSLDVEDEKMKDQATQWQLLDNPTEGSNSKNKESRKLVSTKSKSTQWETPKEELGVQYTSSQATISQSMISPSTLSRQRTKSTKSQSTQWETPVGSISQPSKCKPTNNLWSRNKSKRGSSTSTQSTDWSLPKSGSQKTGSTMSLTSSNKSLKIHSTKSQALDRKLFRKMSTLSQPVGKPAKCRAVRLLAKKTHLEESVRNQSVGPSTSSHLQSESIKSGSLNDTNSFRYSPNRSSLRSRSLGSRYTAKRSMGNLSLKEHSIQTSFEDPDSQSQSSRKNLEGEKSTESYSRKEKSDKQQCLAEFLEEPSSNILISKNDRPVPSREAANQTQHFFTRSPRIDMTRGRIQRPRLEKHTRENVPLTEKDFCSKTQGENSGEIYSLRKSSVRFSSSSQSAQTQSLLGQSVVFQSSIKQSSGRPSSAKQSPARQFQTKQTTIRQSALKTVSVKQLAGNNSVLRPSPTSPARHSPSPRPTRRISPERQSLDNRPSSGRQSPSQQSPKRQSPARHPSVRKSPTSQSPSRPRSRRSSSDRSPPERSLSAQRTSQQRWLERMASGRLSAKHSLSKSMGRKVEDRSLSKIQRNNESLGEALTKKDYSEIPKHHREILGCQEKAGKISRKHESEKQLPLKTPTFKSNSTRKLPRSQSLEVRSQGRSSFIAQSRELRENLAISVPRLIPRSTSARLESLKEHIVPTNTREKSTETGSKEKILRVFEQESLESHETLRRSSLKKSSSKKEETSDASRGKPSGEQSSAPHGKDTESHKSMAKVGGPSGRRECSRGGLKRETTGRPSRSREPYHRKLSIHKDYIGEFSQRRSTSRRMIRDIFQFSEVSQGIPSEIESTKRSAMSQVKDPAETLKQDDTDESQVTSKIMPVTASFKTVAVPIGPSGGSPVSPSDEEGLHGEGMAAPVVDAADASRREEQPSNASKDEGASTSSTDQEAPAVAPRAAEDAIDLKMGSLYGSCAKYSLIDHGRIASKLFTVERTKTNIQSSSLSLSDALAPAPPAAVSRTPSPGQSEPSSALSPGPSSGLSPGTSLAPTPGASTWPSPEMSVEPSSGTSLALSPGASLAPSMPSLRSKSSHSLPPSRTTLPGCRRAHAHLRTRSASPSAAVGLRAGVRHDCATGCHEAFREVCVVTPKRVDVFRLICRMPPQPFSSPPMPLSARGSAPRVAQSFRMAPSLAGNGAPPLLRVRIRSRSLSSARPPATLRSSDMCGRSLSTSSTRSPRVPSWPPPPPPPRAR